LEQLDRGRIELGGRVSDVAAGEGEGESEQSSRESAVAPEAELFA
jgi:hypothetical protein